MKKIWYNDIAEDNLQIVKYQEQLEGLSYTKIHATKILETLSTKKECDIIHNLLFEIERTENKIRMLIREEINKSKYYK